MSVAANTHDLTSVEAFYKRWGPDLFVFCRLFLGDKEQAEKMSANAFVDYCRESSELPVTGEVPHRLLNRAFRAMQPCRGTQPAQRTCDRLEDCIPHLDCNQRVVFIMRNVLGMDWKAISGAAELSLEQVRQFWLTAMLRVRELLPRKFFEKEH
jgi:DNA-directed RNA polymerase specialized sigma24 family protein